MYSTLKINEMTSTIFGTAFGGCIQYLSFADADDGTQTQGDGEKLQYSGILHVFVVNEVHNGYGETAGAGDFCASSRP